MHSNQGSFYRVSKQASELFITEYKKRYGLDYSIIDKVPAKFSKPLLIMGGAGKPEHLFLSLKNERIFGVVTANLFNFLGTGLKDARNFCLDNKINLANFY